MKSLIDFINENSVNEQNCDCSEFKTTNRQFTHYKGHEIETYMETCLKCGKTTYGLEVDGGECCEGGYESRSAALARAKEHIGNYDY